jgi:hypothetical protein
MEKTPRTTEEMRAALLAGQPIHVDELPDAAPREAAALSAASGVEVKRAKVHPFGGLLVVEWGTVTPPSGSSR